MIGTFLNVAGILIGGMIGLFRSKPLEATTESFFKVMLGAFTVFYGLQLTWKSINGSLFDVVRQLIIVILALTLGRIAGKWLQLQEFSNTLGRFARDRITQAKPDGPNAIGDGFKTCTSLYCAAPLGFLGALQDGLSGYFFPLAVKGVMEALATRGLAQVFGWGVMLSAVPVLALQGTITLVSAELLRPFLDTHQLVNAVNATGGLLVFSVALVILELKRIELAEYLPSLAFAPLLTWVWRYAAGGA